MMGLSRNYDLAKLNQNISWRQRCSLTPSCEMEQHSVVLMTLEKDISQGSDPFHGSPILTVLNSGNKGKWGNISSNNPPPILFKIY
jgi:hypothetical protein